MLFHLFFQFIATNIIKIIIFMYVCRTTNKEHHEKHLSVYAISLLMLAGCSSVPITGRKQLLLVSDQEVLSSSLTQYNSYIKSAQKSTNAAQTAMVVRVGKNIAAATEQYLRNNGLAAEIKEFSWEFNLVKAVK